MQRPRASASFLKLVRASRRWLESRDKTIFQFNALDSGGHFAAWNSRQPLRIKDNVPVFALNVAFNHDA
jgi:hypothetical protein